MHGRMVRSLCSCPLINEIKALSSFEEYTNKYLWASWQTKSHAISAPPDFKNAQNGMPVGEAPALILPDTTYYEEYNEKGPELLGPFMSNEKFWQYPDFQRK